MKEEQLENIAERIDEGATGKPEAFQASLEALWQSPDQATVRAVLQLAVEAQDPLSSIGRICRDALVSAADLESLCRATYWRDPRSVCENPRCIALLHLCDARITGGRLDPAKHRRYRKIRERLWRASHIERTDRAEEIQRLAAVRNLVAPGLLRNYRELLSR